MINTIEERAATLCDRVPCLTREGVEKCTFCGEANDHLHHIPDPNIDPGKWDPMDESQYWDVCVVCHQIMLDAWGRPEASERRSEPRRS